MDTPYDETSVLFTYLWNNYPSLFTDSERVVMKAMIGEAKASVTTKPILAARIRKMFGSIQAPAVSTELTEGEAEFKLRVCKRIVAAYKADAMINRCPQCFRIARTPRAKQCLWCGHAWHID
jgi:hypothetical protein